MRFVYNDLNTAPMRAATPEPTMESNLAAIAALNKLASLPGAAQLSYDEAKALQEFIWQFENMQHRITVTQFIIDEWDEKNPQHKNERT